MFDSRWKIVTSGGAASKWEFRDKGRKKSGKRWKERGKKGT